MTFRIFRWNHFSEDENFESKERRRKEIYSYSKYRLTVTIKGGTQKKKKTSVLITLLNSIKFASLIDELIVPNFKKKGIKEATQLRTNFSKY